MLNADVHLGDLLLSMWMGPRGYMEPVTRTSAICPPSECDSWRESRANETDCSQTMETSRPILTAAHAGVVPTACHTPPGLLVSPHVGWTHGGGL